MKSFFCLVFVASSMLLTLGTGPSKTANDSVVGPVSPPVRVLDVKLGGANSQAQKDDWPGGLEIQIENTSDKPIQYLVLYAELAGGTASADRIQIPLRYGQVFADAKSGKVEMFQPGATVTLRAARIDCERVKQLVATGFIPAAKDFQPNLQMVLFADRTSWAGGRLHYQDPNDPKRWIVAEESGRETHTSEFFGMSFLKASLKSSSKPETCYRYEGYYIEFCCFNSTDAPIYLMNAVMTPDPTGNKHPITHQPCCPGTSNCCSQVWYAAGCEQD